MKRLWSFLAVTALAVPLYAAGTAEARIIYNTDEGTTNANTFTIDSDASSGDDGEDITLQFGDGGQSITYDNINSYFTISDDLDFGGNQARNMALFSGSDTSSVAAPVEGMVFWDTDDDTVYVYDSNTTDWIAIGGLAGGNSDTLDNLDSTQFLRSDTSNNFTNGTLTFDSGTSLVGASGSTVNLNNSDVDLNGVNNNTLTLDEDNTGGDIVLQFGATLAESLTWNNGAGRFDISDDLGVDGNITQNGTAFTLDGDNAGAGANLDIVANQGSDSDGTLRYNATTNRWELSNDGGAFDALVGATSAQALTNKTIDGDDNTLQDIDFSSMKERTKSDKLSPEFPNMTLTEPDGAGANSGNHSGVLMTDRDATEGMNFYSWESKKTALNDYTIALSWYLPEDFTSWQNPSVSFQYLTEYAAAADNAVSVVVKNASGTTVASASNLASATWGTADLDLTSGTFNPGELMTIHFTLKSRRQGGGVSADPAHARIGDVTLHYNGR